MEKQIENKKTLETINTYMHGDKKGNKIKSYIKMMRLKHYVKNFLIFLPLVFSGQINNFSKVLSCIMGIISFSLLSSAVYTLNDLKDVEKDKKHPIKRNRPIASGSISKTEAIIFIIVLLALAIIINLCLCKIGNISLRNTIIVSGLETLYFIINIAYSCGLKNIPILDVVILAAGFVIRLIYGAFITEIEISNWLYLTVMSGSFYMGFGKRRNEGIKQGENSREVLKKYNQDFLDKFIYVCLILCIVFYSLWCIDIKTIERVGNSYMIWTIPLVLIIFMKYSLDIEGNSFGDPVDVLLSDKILLTLVLILIVTMIGILYII